MHRTQLPLKSNLFVNREKEQCQVSIWVTVSLVGLLQRREANGTPSSRFHKIPLLVLPYFILQSLGPHKGKITGSTAKKEMVKSRLPNPVLAKIWRLADVDQVTPRYL